MPDINTIYRWSKSHVTLVRCREKKHYILVAGYNLASLKILLEEVVELILADMIRHITKSVIDCFQQLIEKNENN